MTLYKKIPWLPIYRKVTVSCPASDQILSLNRVESHRKALKRVEWGLYLLLAGTVLSAALKQIGFQQVGNYIAGTGVGIIIHGLITATMMEHWKSVTIGVVVVGCGIVVYLFRNKGFTIPKISKFRKPC